MANILGDLIAKLFKSKIVQDQVGNLVQDKIGDLVGGLFGGGSTAATTSGKKPAKKKSEGFSLTDLFTSGFMKENTSFPSIGDFLGAGNLKATSLDEISSLPQNQMHDLAANGTKFDGWREMLGAAVAEAITGKNKNVDPSSLDLSKLMNADFMKSNTKFASLTDFMQAAGVDSEDALKASSSKKVDELVSEDDSNGFGNWKDLLGSAVTSFLKK